MEGRFGAQTVAGEAMAFRRAFLVRDQIQLHLAPELVRGSLQFDVRSGGIVLRLGL